MGCISLIQNFFKFLLKDLQKWATRSVPGQNFKLGGNTPFDFLDCVHTLKETQIALNTRVISKKHEQKFLLHDLKEVLATQPITFSPTFRNFVLKVGKKEIQNAKQRDLPKWHLLQGKIAT